MDKAINPSQIIELIEAEISKSAPEYRKYLLYQIGANELHFSINFSCPAEGAQQVKKIMLSIGENFGLVTTIGKMPD